MRLFDRRSLVSQIMIILLLFNIVTVTAFSIYITGQDRKETMENIEYSLQAIADEKANTVSLVMGQIVKEAESFASFATEYLSSETDSTLSESYVRDEKGILYRQLETADPSTLSSVFYPANASLTEEAIRVINATEKLDRLMQSMMERNPYIQWAYVATEDGFLRTFPYSKIDTFDPNHLQKNDPFYLVADQKNNPTRKTVWTSPYVDFLGTGWMITCSVPLYDGDRFLGVACVDMRLDTINKEFLKDFRLGKGGFVCLIDENGNVIYHPAVVPQGGAKGQTFMTNIVRDTDLDPAYKAALGKILDGYSGVVSYTAGDSSSHLVAHAKVEWQPWIVAVEIIQSQYLQLNRLGQNNIWNFSLIILIIYIFIAVFLYRQFSKPFSRLTEQAESISKGDFEYREPIKNYYEMEILSDAFNTMSARMKEFTDSLISKNNEIQSVIDGIGGMLMILTPEMDIINMSRNAVTALALPKEQIQNRKCFSVLADGVEICHSCAAAEAVRTKSTQFARISLKEEIYQNTYYPILDGAGEVSEIIVHSQKITKRVLLENELAQSEKMSAVGQLTAAIAHELKNPLAIIKGSAYLLNSYTKDRNEPAIAESVNTIVETTDNAEKVIYNLLDFSNPSPRKNSVGSITKIVEQIILLTKRNSTAHNVLIKTSFDPDPLIYDGNIEPLKHILMNLVTNAINAMPNGGVITISGHVDESEGDRMIIAVRDEGTGIAPELQPKIFGAFFTTDGNGSGSGMGLWIAKIMAEKMDGTIELFSSTEKGSEFRIILPVREKKG